jgi:ProP effector
MERWPTAFPAHPEAIRPLAVGIHQFLEKQFPDRSPEQIRRAIAQWRYPRLGAYLRAVARGGARYDLDGNPCGEITEGEKENARQRLYEWRAKRKAQAAAAAAVSSPDSSSPEPTPLPLPDVPAGEF